MSDPQFTTATYVSGNRFAVSNPAGDSFVPEFIPGLRVRADCQADGVFLGTVTAASHDAGTGRTLVDLTVDAGASLTANLTAVLHGNDVPESLCNHVEQHFIGGRDAFLKATTAFSGLVKLASTAEAQAGTVADKAVTPAGLAATAKGLISANTTISVAATGSDTTGDGTSGAPFASIAKALSSIAGKLIASGATVTIQVADGTYSIASTITVDHPDADKIQIVGNTSAETTVAIAAIDTTAKTITVAGDHAGSVQVGDIIGLTGSSTSGVNGAYLVSGVEYAGGNTVITCSAETFASATVGGGSVVLKPCNRCVLNVVAGVFALTITKPFAGITGFRVNSLGGSGRFAYVSGVSATIGGKLIVNGFYYGVFAFNNAFLQCNGAILKGCSYAILATMVGSISIYAQTIIDTASAMAVTAQRGSFISAATAFTILRNCTGSYSPAINTAGNGNSQISST